MRRFCELLEDEFPPALLEKTFRERLGETFDLLKHRSVLVEAGIVERYPCRTPGGDGCPMRLVDNDDGTYDAVCGMNPPQCDDILGLTLRDLETYRLDLEGLARALVEAAELELRFDGRLIPPYTYRIGDLVRGRGQPARVYFAARPGHPSFPAVAGWVHATSGGAEDILLVPTFRWLPSEAENRSGLRLVALDRALHATNGRLVLDLEEPKPTPARIGEPQAGYVAGAHCVAYSNDHPAGRAIDRETYDAIVARAGELDLFIDGTSDKVRVHKRGHDQPAKSDKLTAAQFKMLLGYVERAAEGQPFWRPVRIGGPHQSADAAQQTFKRMRRAMDTRLGGQSYLVFKHRRAFHGGDGEYAFIPPPRFRYCILAPMPG